MKSIQIPTGTSCINVPNDTNVSYCSHQFCSDTLLIYTNDQRVDMRHVLCKCDTPDIFCVKHQKEMRFKCQVCCPLCAAYDCFNNTGKTKCGCEDCENTLCGECTGMGRIYCELHKK